MSDPDDPRSPAGDDETSPSTSTDDDAPDTAGSPADPESIVPPDELGASRRLDPRIRYKWIATAAVSALISAVVVGFVTQLVASETAVLSEDPTVAYGVSEVAVQVGAVALMVFLVVGVGRAVLYYRSWRYEVREDSLYLTRGVLTRRQTVAPYVRVQHIDTQRSPFDRLLGLSSLVVYTAGTRGADVTIPGLTYDRAATLQTRLKRLAIATEEEDAV